MSKQEEKEPHQLIESLRREIAETANLQPTVLDKIGEHLDYLGLLGVAVGLGSVLLAGADVLGWALAVFSVATTAFDRLWRRPRMRAKETERLRALDVMTHKLDQLERRLRR